MTAKTCIFISILFLFCLIYYSHFMIYNFKTLVVFSCPIELLYLKYCVVFRIFSCFSFLSVNQLMFLDTVTFLYFSYSVFHFSCWSKLRPLQDVIVLKRSCRHALKFNSRCLVLWYCRFEGISWNFDETLIAYVAEEPSPVKPTFNDLGYKKSGSDDKDSSSWKGQGDWEEDWGETYAGKRQPALFVINIARFYIKFIFIQ